MTELSTALDTELRKASVRMFGAVQVDLPGSTIRLIDGSGFVVLNGDTFTGKDDVFGALAGVSDYTDGSDDQAPSLTLTFLPPSRDAMAALSSPAAQGSRVQIWTGALDSVTGLAIDTQLEFLGETNVPTLKIGQNSRSLEITVNSAFEQFFAADEGARLNDGFHESIWPGELGLEYVVSIDQSEPWGIDSAVPALKVAATVGQAGYY